MIGLRRRCYVIQSQIKNIEYYFFPISNYTMIQIQSIGLPTKILLVLFLRSCCLILALMFFIVYIYLLMPYSIQCSLQISPSLFLTLLFTLWLERNTGYLLLYSLLYCLLYGDNAEYTQLYSLLYCLLYGWKVIQDISYSIPYTIVYSMAGRYYRIYPTLFLTLLFTLWLKVIQDIFYSIPYSIVYSMTRR